ncbi:hypothetical protein [Rhizorhapis sp.]|uniref:hypothetical protein n=1 Tax=Rhizorhapis sp. TaxID=1968842 RepID=UPI002B49856D|nr:hypothetical protein [Rhizorhapis sp.]HKR17434.1 hypothetical protein [Rhizorhapis sp.]
MQANNCLADAQRLARLHAEIAGQAIALVEESDDGFPFRHGRARQVGGLAAVRRRLGSVFQPHRTFIGLVVGGQLVTASSQKQSRQDRSRQSTPHDASGLHAS